MAERFEKPSQPEDSVAQAAEDLAMIFPESTITIAGETVTIIEYPFISWLQLKAQHKSFLEELAKLVGESAQGLVLDEVLEFFEDHFNEVQYLLAASIEKPVDFFDGLRAAEIDQLMVAWWNVNQHFFLRSIQRTLRKQAKQSAGQTSSSL